MKVIVSGNLVFDGNVQSNKADDLLYATARLAENIKDGTTNYYNLVAFDDKAVISFFDLEKGKFVRIEGTLEVKPYMNPKTYVIEIIRTIKNISRICILNDETKIMDEIYHKKWEGGDKEW